MLGSRRTTSDRPLFDEVTIVLEIHPIVNSQVGCNLGF